MWYFILNLKKKCFSIDSLYSNLTIYRLISLKCSNIKKYLTDTVINIIKLRIQIKNTFKIILFYLNRFSLVIENNILLSAF